MKNIIVLSMTFLTICLPQLASALTPDYFLICKDIQTSTGQKFSRGTLFRVADAPSTSTEPVKVVQKTPDLPYLTFPPELGFYFSVQDTYKFATSLSIPPVHIKNNELIETACGPHAQDFSVGGYTFTDLGSKLRAKDEQRKAADEAYERNQKALKEQQKAAREALERRLQEEDAQTQRELQARSQREWIAREKEQLKSREEERQRAAAQKVEEDKYRAKQEETARRKQAALAKYNVKAEVSVDELCQNPFQYEGKVILIRKPNYMKMLERNLALFSSSGIAAENQFFMSNMPTDYKDGFKDLIAKGKGTTNAVNALGAKIKVPLVQYIGEYSSY